MNKSPKPPAPKKWHTQHEKILKTWGETSSCYRYLHFKSYLKYKNLNMRFSMPIIVISTITGTANFAQETFPDSWAEYVPLGIGGLNLFAAIMATVSQFLKISELMEAHRVASISYGKLARDIRLELALPIADRRHSGDDMVSRCSTEYDRLIEQSPPPPGEIIQKVVKTFRETQAFEKPEITEIKPIQAFDQTKENIVTSTVKDDFKKGLKLFGKPDNPAPPVRRDTFTNGIKEHTVNVFSESVPTYNPKEKVLNELKELKMKNLVSLRNSADEATHDPSDINVPEPEVEEPVESTEPESEPEVTDTSNVTIVVDNGDEAK